MAIKEIENEVDRILKLLREKIRDQGFTQLRVQEALGWGRTYISQLFRKQKSLRFDQILQILHVIEIDPVEFFLEFYRLPTRDIEGLLPVRYGTRTIYLPTEDVESTHAVDDLHTMMSGLVQLLIQKNVIENDEYTAAITAIGEESGEQGLPQ